MWVHSHLTADFKLGKACAWLSAVYFRPELRPSNNVGENSTKDLTFLYGPAKVTLLSLIESILIANTDNATMQHGDPHYRGLSRCYYIIGPSVSYHKIHILYSPWIVSYSFCDVIRTKLSTNLKIRR